MLVHLTLSFTTAKPVQASIPLWLSSESAASWAPAVAELTAEGEWKSLQNLLSYPHDQAREN